VIAVTKCVLRSRSSAARLSRLDIRRYRSREPPPHRGRPVLFAAVIAYPYIPGSGTDAFKGCQCVRWRHRVAGSAGLVNQLMSGLTLTLLERAARPGTRLQNR
jgi:hypothetical protein